MASGNMKDIKRRIKSVQSTMQITKAMAHNAVPNVNTFRRSTRTGLGEGLRTLGSIIGANFIPLPYLGARVTGARPRNRRTS